MSPYKVEHPSDTEDGLDVGLSSEDEVEGLPADPGRAHRVFMTGPPLTPEPTGGDEVVVKRRALRRVKQQVSALLRGEDLPEGAQAREVAEVPYDSLQFQGTPRSVPSVNKSSRLITDYCTIWECTGGKSSPVKSVARSWQVGRC